VKEQNKEFFAAVADDGIFLTTEHTHEMCDLFEYAVAGVVAVAVVDILEVIDVEHQTRHGNVVAGRLGEPCFEEGIERAAIVGAGERVGQGEFGQTFVFFEKLIQLQFLSDEGPDSGRQLGRLKRLDEEFDSTQVESSDPGFYVICGRDEDDRQGIVARLDTDRAQHVETVFVGQGQIEKDKIRDALRKHLEGFVATRGGFDFEVFPTKRVLQRGQL